MTKLLSKLPVNKKFVISGPVGQVNEEAIRDAQKIVEKFSADNSDTFATFQFPAPYQLWRDAPEDGWNLWMVPKGKYSGTWPKRYASMVWKTFGLRPPESLLVKFGDALSKSACTEDKYTVDFTNECDWEPGDFGENENSCWWREYDHARTGLFENGGMAMRFFYTNGRGTGRCWLFEHDEVIYSFNAYHKKNLSLYNMACLLATHLGVSYKRVPLVAGGAYINGECGFAVAPIDKLQELNGTIALDFVRNQAECSCAWCDRDIFEGDDSYQTANDNTICERCYRNHSFTCEDCGEIFHADDCRENPDGDSVCEGCFEENYFTCRKCGEVKDIGEMKRIKDGGSMYCDDCVGECKECGDVYYHHNLTEGKCPSCIEKEGEK